MLYINVWMIGDIGSLMAKAIGVFHTGHTHTLKMGIAFGNGSFPFSGLVRLMGNGD